jgi:3-phenylpropionate/cinnamic acid dioxygenase small subunit
MNAEDERAIIAVLVRYATAIDRRDWPLLTSCFTEDVEADYGDIGTWHGRDAIVHHMTQGHAKIGPTLHRITNFVVAGEADEARAVCYVDALLMRFESGGMFRQAHGWYEDRLVRSNEGWKIRSRRFVPVLIQQPSSEG